MNHVDRKLLKELKNGVNYSDNLPVYSSQMLHLEYEYSYVMAALHYYTLGEVLLEDTDTLSKDFIDLAGKLQGCIRDSLVSGGKEQAKTVVEDLDGLRNDIIYKMQILTAYTDALQIYEYMLNRMEAGVLDLVESVDVAKLCDNVYQYIFKENDNMVINSKLQMVTAQLPMRMTKNKFYDTLSAALSIYNGSEKANFHEFVERIRGAVLLDKPEGYETEYSDIYASIEKLEGLDYQNMTKEVFLDAMGLVASEAEHINDIVTNYLMMTDVVNSVYATVVAIPFANVLSDTLDTSKQIIVKVYNAIENKDELQEEIGDLLVSLEGVQENLLEELAAYEGIFYEVEQEVLNSGVSEESVQVISVLKDMQQLHSNSVFIDLRKESVSDELADVEYIGEVEKKLEADLDTLFATCGRAKKRAVMAGVIGQLPVIFNNTQEIQQYISYALSSCSNDSEMTAVAKLLDDLMME